MADRHLQRWSMWLTIREMQIKTTMRCHLTCVRMAVIRKNTNKKCCEHMKKREPLCTVSENIKWYSHCGKQYGGFLKNLKENYHSTQQFHSWIYIYEKNKNTNSKIYMYPNIHNSIIYNCQDMGATWVSINRWMDKKIWFIYRTEYYSAIKKEQNNPFAATWIDLEGIMLSEISQMRKTNTIW